MRSRPRILIAALVAGMMTASVIAVALLVATEWFAAHPCWAYSNAEWCGHFCDDDPCACPDRRAIPEPYGAGPGCVP